MLEPHRLIGSGIARVHDVFDDLLAIVGRSESRCNRAGLDAVVM